MNVNMEKSKEKIRTEYIPVWLFSKQTYIKKLVHNFMMCGRILKFGTKSGLKPLFIRALKKSDFR